MNFKINKNNLRQFHTQTFVCAFNKSHVILTALHFSCFFTCGGSAKKSKGGRERKKTKPYPLLADFPAQKDCSKKLLLRNISYNWDLLVFGPEFAMLRTPRPVWERLGRNSSLKGFPQKDSPPGNGEREWGRKENTMGERQTKTQGKTRKWKHCIQLLLQVRLQTGITTSPETSHAFVMILIHLRSVDEVCTKDIMMFHSRKSTGVINNGCSPFWFQSPGIMHAGYGLLDHTNMALENVDFKNPKKPAEQMFITEGNVLNMPGLEETKCVLLRQTECKNNKKSPQGTHNVWDKNKKQTQNYVLRTCCQWNIIGETEFMLLAGQQRIVNALFHLFVHQWHHIPFTAASSFNLMCQEGSWEHDQT